jgi:hypothetical protein
MKKRLIKLAIITTFVITNFSCKDDSSQSLKPDTTDYPKNFSSSSSSIDSTSINIVSEKIIDVFEAITTLSQANYCQLKDILQSSESDSIKKYQISQIESLSGVYSAIDNL